MARVIYPDAALRVFLTASAATSADRDFQQRLPKGRPGKLSGFLQDFQQRGARDSLRATAPLRVAVGPKVLETTD